MVKGDDMSAGGALEGSDGFEVLARGAARNQDAVGAAKAQAVSTRQEKGVFEQL